MKNIHLLPQEEPKHETLEEAAERILLGEGLDLSDYDERYIIKAMCNIANWQAQRMYTLEQISKEFIGEDGQSGYFDDWLDYRLDSKNKLSFREWFEQVKKTR